jgi:photosystem II stability/assembly factor-like uncharacterized protein
MKPIALIIVLSIIIAFILVFTSSSVSIFSSFPPFKALQSNGTGVIQQKKETGSIYRTIDSGKIWFPQSVISTQIGNGDIRIYDIVLDARDSNIVYAGTYGHGIIKSVNNGQDWEQIFDRNNILFSNSSVLKIVQDRKNPDILYVAAYQNKRGVFLKSTDGGLSFIQTYITELDEYAVSAIAINPAKNNIIYLGTTQGGFFTSHNFGETWEATKWITGSISDIVTNPSNSKEIYVVTSNRGLFRTSDGGRTWKGFSKELSRAAARNQIRSIQIDPINTNIIFLGVTNGVLRSTDRGASWEFLGLLIPPKNLPIDAVKINPVNRNEIYVAAHDLMYKSEDGGINWSVQRIPLSNKEKRIAEIEIDRKDPKNVYFGVR